jgi:hypothetical protein
LPEGAGAESLITALPFHNILGEAPDLSNPKILSMVDYIEKKITCY